MKRPYADLHLCPNIIDTKTISTMISKAAELGYKLIALPLPANYTEQDLQQIRKLCTEAKIEFARRIDLKPKTPNELTRNLRKLRRRFEIVAVLCESKSVSRQAAKDRRVDLLNFPNLHARFFDTAEAELASESLASLEIDMKPLLALQGYDRTRLLANLRKETAITKAFNIPIVISSGTSNQLLIRKPAELAALASLFDLDKQLALNAVSNNPVSIIKRNREKLKPQFVAPGIRVIRKGKDC